MWVTEIDGDWAKVTYRGKKYYMSTWDINPINQTVDAAVEIMSGPSKTYYKIGNSFSTAGLKVVDWAGSVKNDITKKLSFYISEDKFVKKIRTSRNQDKERLQVQNGRNATDYYEI